MAVTVKIEHLESLLKGHINGEAVRHTITRLTNPGENFLSLVLKVDVTVKNGKKEEILSTVAKLMPPSHLAEGNVFAGLDQITFNNEIVWYDKIVPLFEEFEKEYAVQGLTDIYPKYYGGRLNLESDSDKIDKNAVVLLENLKDYKNGDRLVGFDFETSKDVLKALAKFHGLPMAFRHHKRKEFDEKILPHLNIRPKELPPDEFEKNFIATLEQNPECVPLIPRCKEALKNDTLINLTLEYRDPWGTTVHDDFWINNMMLRETGGRPDVKILDFQLVLFKSFAVDLVFFLLTSVADSVQKTRLDELIRYYYDQLIDILKQFKVDTDQFKYEDYLNEIKTETKAGQFSHASRFVNIIFMDKGAVPDVIMKMDGNIFKDLLTGKQPRPMEKHWLITKICAEKNWI